MKKTAITIIIIIISLSSIYAQEVKIAQGKLTVDGCFWGLYRYTKDSTTINSFARKNAFVGMTAAITNWATLRLYMDIANITSKPLYDAYATIKANSRLSFIFGQFKLPLGIEVLTKPQNLELIEYSLIGRDPMRTPKGTRDIGIQGAYTHRLFDFTVAAVNGDGRNVLQDGDNYKSFAGRFIAKPLPQKLIFASINTYLGKYTPNTTYDRIGLELNVVLNQIIFKTEFLSTKDGTLKGSGYYVQAGYNWKKIQPIFRYSAFKYENSDNLNEFVIGLNFRPLSDNVKLMLNYKHEQLNSSLNQNGILVQLQLAF
jgi:hypothetical protein